MIGNFIVSKQLEMDKKIDNIKAGIVIRLPLNSKCLLTVSEWQTMKNILMICIMTK